MRVYSDILNKPFDTEKELKEAESKFKKEKEQKELEKEKEKTALSKAKKAEADKVQLTNKEVDIATENLRKVRKEAQEIINIAYKEAEDKLRAAYSQLNDAQEKKYAALKEFNDKFGPYKTFTYYTGEKAYEEFKKEMDRFSNMFFPRFFF